MTSAVTFWINRQEIQISRVHFRAWSTFIGPFVLTLWPKESEKEANLPRWRRCFTNYYLSLSCAFASVGMRAITGTFWCSDSTVKTFHLWEYCAIRFLAIYDSSHFSSTLFGVSSYEFLNDFHDIWKWAKKWGDGWSVNDNTYSEVTGEWAVENTKSKNLYLFTHFFILLRQRFVHSDNRTMMGSSVL